MCHLFLKIFLNMKFLNRIKSKTRLRDDDNRSFSNASSIPHGYESSIPYARPGQWPNPTSRWPQPLLELLMSYVCPHSRDDTFTPCEDSVNDGGCVLCDMRDLSMCSLVNKQWSDAAQNVLCVCSSFSCGPLSANWGLP